MGLNTKTGWPADGLDVTLTLTLTWSSIDIWNNELAVRQSPAGKDLNTEAEEPTLLGAVI
jgi:hypothetical protein